MATAYLYFDDRTTRKKGVYPIVIMISHKGDDLHINTGYKARPGDWNSAKQRMRDSYTGHLEANEAIYDMLHKVEGFLQQSLHAHSKVSCKSVRDQAMAFLSGEKPEAPTLYRIWTDEVLELRELGRHSYALDHENAIRSVKKFAGTELYPEDITAEWLRKYERWNLKKGNKLNGFAPYLRCLRRMLNIAIEKGFLTLDKYPFGRAYKIKRERTKKRAVKKNIMDTLMGMRYESGSAKWHHHNFLAYMYHARGMNFIDLAYLTVEQAQDRIRYTRRKTKKDYNIGHTAVTRTITDYYAVGKKKGDYLFPIMTGYTGKDSRSLWHYKTMLRDHNEALKEICKDAGLDVDMTSYVIRHSWATILKKQGVSTSLISEGMGHSTEDMTQTYLDEFEDTELDKLNDYL